ncbi:SRPBCC family protein [Chelativorans salis]|uniref:SRPBCC family protein n=1 Tax=Chelativorans salis TaxID=2978478 RepID=A0ABT2LKS6_9HYPH|nr:SRPBCC family protein [Chelativorans sp. EGI FJ00035]MCT7375165.1 SRPBCC family protein [Chelativorans sp. EGI FJ00035]
MSTEKPSFVYAIYIATTPEKLWQALQDPEMTKDYWGRSRNVSDWMPGSRWEHQNYDDSSIVDVAGEVVESDPPRRLVVTWADPEDAGDVSKHSRVTFEIEPAHDSVRLTVTHEGLERDPKKLTAVSQGWPAILSSLKTLLETGEALPGTKRRWGRRAA